MKRDMKIKLIKKYASRFISMNPLFHDSLSILKESPHGCRTNLNTQLLLPPIILPLRWNLPRHFWHNKFLALIQVRHWLLAVQRRLIHHEVGNSCIMKTRTLPCSNTSRNTKHPFHRTTRSGDSQSIANHLPEIWIFMMMRFPQSQRRLDAWIVVRTNVTFIVISTRTLLGTFG